MHTPHLEGLHVAILVCDNFEQTEMTAPRAALERAGAEVTLIAPKSGEVHGFQHDKVGDAFEVDLELADAVPEDYDALLLPGGALNADRLRSEAAAIAFVQAIDRVGKPIAAICHAPWVLISAGLTEGRRMTSYHTIKDDIINSGAEYTDEEFVLDGNWVTSRQPSDIPAFNQQMIALFSEHIPAQTNL